MTLSGIIDTTPAVELPATNVTAIQDRLFIGLQEAKQFLKISLETELLVIGINTDPPASTEIFLWLNDEKITFTTDADPTQLEVAAGLVSAINLSGQAPVLDAVDNLDGTYIIGANPVGTPFIAFPDLNQDVVPSDLDDALIAALITIAKQMADAYTNNPFEESAIVDGVIVESDATIPEAVKMGVLQLVRWLNDDASGSLIASGPVKVQKAGDIRIEYETGKSAEELGGSQLPQIVKAILDMYRFIPGI